MLIWTGDDHDGACNCPECEAQDLIEIRQGGAQLEAAAAAPLEAAAGGAQLEAVRRQAQLERQAHDAIDRYAELLRAEDRAVEEIRRAVAEGASLAGGLRQLAAAVNARLAHEKAQGWTDDQALDVELGIMDGQGAADAAR